LPAAEAAPQALAAPLAAETALSAPIAPALTAAPLAPAAALPAEAEAPPLAPAESAAARGSLIPLAMVFAGAAAVLFGLWKVLAQLNAEPPVAAYRPVTAPPPEPVAAPRPAPAALEPAPRSGGLLGGHYELGRELGKGGMGVVYEGRDVKLDRRVALKKMKPEVGSTKRGRELFLSEARLVAKLQHPNIVGIHAIVEDADDLYLVFEYVDGETLDDLILREKFLPPGRAMEILTGVAAAVDHAHAERVIHRDLKPANIMIDKGGRPKVMDFGIAHQAKITVSRMTTAEAFGTMAYMPPEQELGQAVRESDIYAFAAVTYEALTGGLAFPGPNFHLQKSSMAFLRPSQTDPTLPRALDGIFERAFQPEPKRRHPTTGEFVAELGAALGRKG
jgi:serine/threonine protein kinase